MTTFYEQIKTVLEEARQKAYRAVNFGMVEAYWHIGQLIVEEEQGGNSRAEYGSCLLKYLAEWLTQDFDESNLRYIRLFYKAFPIRDALRHELSWTHVLNGSQQLFASKCKLFLPTEEELMAEIERDKQLLEQNRRIK
ncbi:DUF1016 N-terminal domain-containing protein [Spirosoma aerolatum]|uniref:DUF1016 N-terminal domain-containing protein n=1 Tax=Spirosoma aerolatum TaxID=1211326 RepID=UPI0009AC4884|nr:DUF1016 N-terminal domain-containing protein [Spirosoma aerolatum]